MRLALPSIERIPGGRAFASLSRRVRTLIIATIIFAVLFALSLTLPVPYVVLSPGPTLNTLGADPNGQPIITIQGRKANKTTGNLNLTTVQETTDSLSAFQALSAWLQHDKVVVPRSSVIPPGQSEQQTNQQNTQDFISSQDSATAAALCELGYPKAFGIFDVGSKTPSSGILHPGDALVSVDGKPVASQQQLLNVLKAIAPGTKVAIAIKRAGKAETVSVTLGKPPAGAQRSGGYLGISTDNTCLAPFAIHLGLADEIGGPSAGMMFALGIIDKVGSTDLTKGRFIAGTGTIDPNGVVGPIGGIQLKMIAARDKGATVFLAPAGNCSDVRKATPAGLQVVKVGTLHEAVQDLLKIQKGQSVPGC